MAALGEAKNGFPALMGSVTVMFPIPSFPAATTSPPTTWNQDGTRVGMVKVNVEDVRGGAEVPLLATTYQEYVAGTSGAVV